MQPVRSRFWSWRRKRLGKFVKRGILGPARRFAPRISTNRIRDCVKEVRSGVPSDILERFNGVQIVLIGPGERGFEEAALACVPVVARMGFRGATSIPQRTTSRCDIGFYTGLHARRLLDDSERGESPAIPPVAVFRSEVPVESLGRLAGGVRAFGFDDEPVKTLFRGILPNFGPEVLIFLLALKPSQLMVSHIDLFTTARYPAGYANKSIQSVDAEHFRRETAAVRQSMAWHNPFTHLSFFEALRSIPNVTFSEQLEEIITKGSRAYQALLDDLYFKA